jgi:hypothetical protein
VARRITALLTMAAVIGLTLFVIWRVYLHHMNGFPKDEPAVVMIGEKITSLFS